MDISRKKLLPILKIANHIAKTSRYGDIVQFDLSRMIVRDEASFLNIAVDDKTEVAPFGVNSTDFLNIISRLSENIAINTIEDNKITLQDGKSAFKLMTTNKFAHDMIVEKNTDNYICDCDEDFFKTLECATAFSLTEPGHIYSSVRIIFCKDTIKIQSTDKIRVFSANITNSTIHNNCDIIISLTFAKMLLKLWKHNNNKAAAVYITDNKIIQFSWSNGCDFAFSLMQGEFSELFGKILDNNVCVTTINIDKEALKKAIDTISAIKTYSVGAILDFNNDMCNLTIKTNVAEVETGCETKQTGPSIKLQINYETLALFCDCTDGDNLYLEIKDKTSPIVLRGQNWKGILLPMIHDNG